MTVDPNQYEYSALAKQLGDLNRQVGIYTVKVIDRMQKSVFDESLIEEAEKEKAKLIEEVGVAEDNLIEYFLDERNSITKQVIKITDPAIYAHAVNVLSSVDVRIRECSLWEHYSSNPRMFFSVVKKFYADYLTRNFQIPITAAFNLDRFSREYKKYKLPPAELRDLVRTEVPLKQKELLTFLLEQGKKVANSIGVYLPKDYAEIKLIPVDYTIATGGENTIRINKQIMEEEPLDTTYCIIHEFGHVLREKITKQLDINPMFKISHSYSFGTVASEGICIEFSEMMVRRLHEEYPECGEKLMRFHHWYLYYSTIRGLASMNYCLNRWGKKRYLATLKSVNGSWSRSKLEWHNLITNLGYKEGYILGYRKAHGENAFRSILQSGYVCLSEL